MNKKKMSFKDFLEVAFPTINPFARKEFSFFHNLIKWFSIRIAFVLYRFGISANLLDFIGLSLTIPFYYLIYISFKEQSLMIFIISYCGIFFILSIDFMDGILARAKMEKNSYGELIDDLSPELIRFFSLVILGYLSENIIIFVLSILNAILQQTYIASTSEKLDIKNKIIISLLRSRYSLHSIRILTCLIVPIFSLLYLISFEYLFVYISLYVLFNLIINLIWIYLTLLIKK